MNLFDALSTRLSIVTITSRLYLFCEIFNLNLEVF